MKKNAGSANSQIRRLWAKITIKALVVAAELFQELLGSTVTGLVGLS